MSSRPNSNLFVCLGVSFASLVEEVLIFQVLRKLARVFKNGQALRSKSSQVESQPPAPQIAHDISSFPILDTAA